MWCGVSTMLRCCQGVLQCTQDIPDVLHMPGCIHCCPHYNKHDSFSTIHRHHWTKVTTNIPARFQDVACAPRHARRAAFQAVHLAERSSSSSSPSPSSASESLSSALPLLKSGSLSLWAVPPF